MIHELSVHCIFTSTMMKVNNIYIIHLNFTIYNNNNHNILMIMVFFSLFKYHYVHPLDAFETTFCLRIKQLADV